ncbi:MAG TPA: RNA polymerase sigma factor, partial [Vicinamibacterales bacterium]
MRELTLTDMERLGAFDEADRTFQMTEEAFRSFYELTARPVRVYLARMTNDDRLADDLLQETYYRFLRSTAAFESDDHRRRYLYRIATNLVHDHRRRPRREVAAPPAAESHPAFSDPHVAERSAR